MQGQAQQVSPVFYIVTIIKPSDSTQPHLYLYLRMFIAKKTTFVNHKPMIQWQANTCAALNKPDKSHFVNHKAHSDQLKPMCCSN